LSANLDSSIDWLVNGAFAELHAEKPFVAGKSNIPVMERYLGLKNSAQQQKQVGIFG
jgi:hypothetical protein